ncbi:MAG TPA: hypothetical protein VFJ63_00010 [Candidatus Bathyarchaeia archaeon]|nr:hypothetical protein [Candidatus Bathyarchaeia archaeon]
MRAFRALISIGGLLIIISVYLLLPGGSISGTDTASIPSGANNFYRIGFNVYKASEIAGSYSLSDGSSITLYVMNDQQLTAYKSGLGTSNMFVTSGPSSTFTASITGPGNVYLVFQHGSSYTNQIQNVSVSWTLDGSNVTILAGGFALLIAGAVLTFIGYRKARSSQPPPSASDVVMFNQPKPPETPPSPPQNSRT